MQFSDGNYKFHLQDKSTFLSCLDQNVSQLKTIFYQAHFPIKDVWDQHRNELSSVLILCGEHRILSDWNNQQVVCDIADLLNMVLLSLGEDLSQLFALTDLACSIIDKLKVKLKSSCYMEYPAAVECFHWVTLNNMVNQPYSFFFFKRLTTSHFCLTLGTISRILCCFCLADFVELT